MTAHEPRLAENNHNAGQAKPAEEINRSGLDKGAEMKTILKTLCALVVVYSWMLASNDDYERLISEPKSFQQIIADYDKAHAEAVRYGAEQTK